MDTEALVRVITERVLAELRTPPAPDGALQVLVLARHDEEVRARLRKRFGENARLVFYGEPAGEQSFSRHVVPFLSCAEMAVLAAGQACCPITRAVLSLLLAGKTVEVLEFEYSRHAQSAPHALYSLYASHEKTLASYGLVKFEEQQPAVLKIREDLVTEKVVRRAAGKNVTELVVAQTAKVTALAEDTARELGVRISKSLF